MNARQPFELGWQGWWHATRRVVRSVASDNLSLVAAGVAFYTLLALFPAAVVVVAVFGLVADSSTAIAAVYEFDQLLPTAATELATEQLVRIADSNDSWLSTGALTGLAVAFWSANRGTKSLITGLNVSYDEQEERSLIHLNLLAFAMTIGLLLLFAALATFATTTASWSDPTGLLTAARWGVALVALHASLATLYRFGPDRRQPRWPWIGIGTVLASLGCVLTSFGFSIYVDYFDAYNETFGTLAGVAITLTWLWANAFVVLCGAEINAELEHETLSDSTVGPDRPRGERGAYVADHVPSEVQETLDAEDREAIVHS